MTTIKNRNYTSAAKYSFDDLFDREKIQQLQDTASAAFGIGMVITTPEGQPITKESHFCRFCLEVVRGSEKGIANCIKSDSVLGRPNKDGPIIAKCLSAGLMDAGASIMIGDFHVASWLLGQVQDESLILSEDQNKEKAVELGIDPELYCREINNVPVMSLHKFEQIANMIFCMSNQISEMGLRNYQLKEELAFRKDLERQLMHNSMHDQLTNLYNRMYYETKIAELDEDKIFPLSVIVGDVNFLKFSNDIFGHNEGDWLLQTISAVLLEEAKPDYIICRCGGDEFYILLPGADYAEAEEYCIRIRMRCSQDYCTVLPPSIALGLGTRKKPAMSLAAVVKQAEEKMYLEKHRMKESNDVVEVIRRILYQTGYLSEDDTERTRILALAFAEHLSFDHSQIINLEQLLEINNLGLIAVPKEQLAKAKENNELKWESIYNITEIEYRLAKMFDASFPIAKAVSQRCEQWDGQGSPNHLFGEQIEYLTRLITVVNYYSQLIDRKPRGSGLDETTAKKMTGEKTGTLLDPVLTKQFLQFLELYR